MENNVVDWKRVGIFIAFAFGIAWLVALGLYLTGGLTATPLHSSCCRWDTWARPAFAHILTRLITREGWHGLYLRPNFKKGWVILADLLGRSCHLCLPGHGSLLCDLSTVLRSHLFSGDKVDGTVRRCRGSDFARD